MKERVKEGGGSKGVTAETKLTVLLQCDINLFLGCCYVTYYHHKLNVHNTPGITQTYISFHLCNINPAEVPAVD